MNSVSPFSIEYLLRSDREEDDQASGNSSEEAVSPKESADFNELPGKNSTFSTGCRPSFLFGNDTANSKHKYKKTSRTSISSYQKEGLEKSFRKSPYLRPEERERLAIQLGLSQVNIQTWYKNRRYKWRRENGTGSIPRVTQTHGAFMRTHTGSHVAPYSAGCCLGHGHLMCQMAMPPWCSGPISYISREYPCPLSKDEEKLQTK